jgi:hypothetical protein
VEEPEDSPSPEPMPPITCSLRIEEWLEHLQMGVYAKTFSENHIDCTNLLLLKDQELKELGVKIIGHRKLILREINEFKRKAIRHNFIA